MLKRVKKAKIAHEPDPLCHSIPGFWDKHTASPLELDDGPLQVTSAFCQATITDLRDDRPC